MLKKSPFLSALLPVGYIALGVVLIIWPSLSTELFCLVAGVCALAYGLYNLFLYWRNRQKGLPCRLELMLGVLFAAIGACILLFSRLLLSVFPFLLGVILLIDGVGKILKAMEIKSVGFSRWWVELIFAVITAGLGMILLFNPFGLVRLAVVFFGISLVVSGVSELIMNIWASR